MKKLVKNFFMALVALMATSAIAADYTSKLVTFSSTGDKYADGTPVVDGEFYALCWSPSETFDGITTELNAVSSTNDVIYVESLAKDGGCPPVIFVVDGEKYNKGNFFVFLLDTRVSANELAPITEKGLPTRVNGSLMANEIKAERGPVGELNVDTSVAKFGAIVNEGEEAYISAIDPVTKSITVANLNPVVKYNITWGKTISDLQTTTEALGAQFSEFKSEVTFYFTDKEDARFFRLKEDK